MTNKQHAINDLFKIKLAITLDSILEKQYLTIKIRIFLLNFENFILLLEYWHEQLKQTLFLYLNFLIF
jgi:hypothetical protein